MNVGILYATGAYLIWGFLPLYWKALQTVPAPQILAHRMVWSLAFLAMLITSKGQWGVLLKSLHSRRTLVTYTGAALLLTVNWLTYIWGVNAGYIIETSLGYFINPLVNVLFGVILLREKLRPFQWVPIALAAVGVLYLTISYGRLPWIALTLAFTFAFYGLLKRQARLASLQGLTLETMILFLPALGFLLFQDSVGTGAFLHQGTLNSFLLAFTGIVTALPLLLFAAAAPRINFSLLGLLQYMAPTIQFIIGVWVFHEPFTQARIIGFSLIWLALILYSSESYFHRQHKAAVRVT